MAKSDTTSVKKRAIRTLIASTRKKNPHADAKAGRDVLQKMITSLSLGHFN